MAEIIIEKPSMQKGMYKLEKPSEELAFAYYIYSILTCQYFSSLLMKCIIPNVCDYVSKFNPKDKTNSWYML
jgi:hypothetical protein